MKVNFKILLLLHLVLAFYSITGILSKLAASEEFLSCNFIILYGGVIFILFIYALVGQQVIKRMPLSAAYANRAITIIGGMIGGVLFFSEVITPGKIIGSILVIVGIVMYVYSSRKENE